MKSVQVNDLSCQPGREVRKKPRGHREHLELSAQPVTQQSHPVPHSGLAYPGEQAVCDGQHRSALVLPYPVHNIQRAGRGGVEWTQVHGRGVHRYLLGAVRQRQLCGSCPAPLPRPKGSGVPSWHCAIPPSPCHHNQFIPTSSIPCPTGAWPRIITMLGSAIIMKVFLGQIWR